MSDNDRNNVDYQDATIELVTTGSRNIFTTFEDDDQALSYYDPDEVNGCETNIQGHDFRSGATLPYDLAMTCAVEDCLEKISEHGGGRGGLDDDVFCVVTSGELIIGGRKQTDSMLASQGFDPTKLGRPSRIFGVDESTDVLPKAKPKPCQNGMNEEVDGFLAKAPERRRLAPGASTSRRRRGMDALPTGGCPPQLEYMSYASSNTQLIKAHLPRYESSPTIASSSSLLSGSYNCSTSENVTGSQRGFFGHVTSPSYQVSTANHEELHYLNDDDYHQLVSSDELRMMNLSNDPNSVHDQAVELTAMTDYRTEQSTDIWQQPFTDEFKLVSESTGCFTQPRDPPGGMQWCTISSSGFRQTLPCSKSASSISYTIPRASEVGQQSPQNLNFRVPWPSPSPIPSPSNAPLDMTSAISSHQNASSSVHLQSPPQPLKFTAPMPSTLGSPTNSGLVALNYRQMTRPPIRRQRRKPVRAHSAAAGATDSVIAPPMNPQLESTDGSGLPSNGKLPQGSGSYSSDISLAQRQMPGLLPSDQLELTTPEDGRFTDRGGRLDIGQSNKENSMNPDVDWTSSVAVPRLHQLQIQSPVQRRPKLRTDTSYMSTVVNASGNTSVPNLTSSDSTGQMTVHPTSLDRSSLANIVQNTTNNTSSSLASLPFPLPAVPPGYRLVITHHPLPTENEQEPQHITQLIIDNPSTSYQASPNFAPCTQPYPGGNNAQSEVADSQAAPRDGGRPTRPSTLDLLPQTTSSAVFNRCSVDGSRTGNGTDSGLVMMKTEPPSPLDTAAGGMHNAPPSVNQVILRPNAGGQLVPPSAPFPGEDLLEMSMREANVFQLASTQRSSGDRQVFTNTNKRGPISGHCGQAVVSTPMSSDSSGGGGGCGTPFLEGLPVGDALLPLNLTGSKSILINSSGVPSYPFEVNNNRVVCRGNGPIDSFSGSNTPSAGAQSSDEWSRAWAPGSISMSDVDGAVAFQDENLAVMFFFHFTE